MKALHKAAIIMKIALRFRKAIFGAPSGTRTQDPLIKSQLLSQVASTKSGVLILIAIRNPLCIRIFYIFIPICQCLLYESVQ